MRLIYAEEAKKELCRACEMHDGDFCMIDENLCRAMAEIDRVPTVDPVKHGHWIKDSEFDQNDNAHYHCSRCGRGDTHAKQVIVNYCWWCGTKMDEEAEG